MKTCGKCKEEKDLTEFSKNKSKGDGLQGTCKDCIRDYNGANKEAIAAYQSKYYSENKETISTQKAKYNKDNKEAIAAREAKYYQENREAITAWGVKYRKDNREKIAESRKKSTKKYREAHPKKDNAHRSVTKALRRGELLKAPCEVCGVPKAQAHHDDYSKPLEVRWLCSLHHRRWHRLNGEGLNG